MRSTDPGIAQRSGAHAMAGGMLRQMAEKVRRAGRNDDTELVHVNRREEAMLKRSGGAGTRNPKTGLREYFSEGGGHEGTGIGSGEDGAGVADATGSSGLASGAQEGEQSALSKTLDKIESWAQSQVSNPTGLAARGVGMLVGGVPGMALSGGIQVGQMIANTISERSQNETGFHEGMNPEIGGSMDKQYGAFGPRETGQGDTIVDADAPGISPSPSPGGYSMSTSGMLVPRQAATADPTPATAPNGAYEYDMAQKRVRWVPKG